MDPQPAPAPDHKATVRACLHKLLRVTLTDGRVVEGVLECYDNRGNLVLSDAADVSRKAQKPFARVVRLGMVLVPGGAARRVVVWREAPPQPGGEQQHAVDEVAEGVRLLKVPEGATDG